MNRFFKSIGQGIRNLVKDLGIGRSAGGEEKPPASKSSPKVEPRPTPPAPPERPIERATSQPRLFPPEEIEDEEELEAEFVREPDPDERWEYVGFQQDGHYEASQERPHYYADPQDAIVYADEIPVSTEIYKD